MSRSDPSSSRSGNVGQGELDLTVQRPIYAPPWDDGRGKDVQEKRPFDESDPRVYYDRISASWRCEVEVDDKAHDAHGEMEWSGVHQAWVRLVDEDQISAQQAAYSVDGVDESTPAATVLRRKDKKRKQREVEEAEGSKAASKQRKRVNTSVYVSGLPLDCTKAEIAKVFARYGVLNEDDQGEARIKMYADAKTGMFKGEALVTYFKEESVELACNVLDESALRAAEGQTQPLMHVEKARFGGEEGEGKGEALNAQEVDQEAHEQRTQAAEGGSQARQQTLSSADRKKAAKRYAKMNGKLNDWRSDSDEDEAVGADGAQVNAADARQVCLRRMFTIAELEDDPSLLLDLKEDVREECETLGKVTNVALWDQEPEGVMTIRFASSEAATLCVEKMDGRFFAGRKIIAHLLAGKPRFRRSGRTFDERSSDDDDDGGEDGEGNQDERQRQDAFGAWLEGEGNAQV